MGRLRRLRRLRYGDLIPSHNRRNRRNRRSAVNAAADTSPPCGPGPAPRSASKSLRCAAPSARPPGGRREPGTPITSEPGRHLHPLRQHRTGRNDAAGPDDARSLSSMLPMPIRHSSSTMQPWRITRCPTPTRLPDDAGHVLIHVDDGAVLEAGLGADDDRRHVAAEHGAVPDARLLAQRHVAHDGGGRGDEGGGVDLGRGYSPAGEGTASGSRPRPAPRPSARDARTTVQTKSRAAFSKVVSSDGSGAGDPRCAPRPTP